MDTRYEVRDAQEVFEALADQAATGGTTEGLIDPQKIASMGSSYGGREDLRARPAVRARHQRR